MTAKAVIKKFYNDGRMFGIMTLMELIVNEEDMPEAIVKSTMSSFMTGFETALRIADRKPDMISGLLLALDQFKLKSKDPQEHPEFEAALEYLTNLYMEDTPG